MGAMIFFVGIYSGDIQCLAYHLPAKESYADAEQGAEKWKDNCVYACVIKLVFSRL